MQQSLRSLLLKN